ncbi:MAG TPA: hypothetical protein VFH51_08125 [Myxococcota bacterium]|nr:hypothetical protein [Myxococcota bacterium]
MDLVFTPASTSSVAAFLLIVAAVIAMTLAGVAVANRRIGGPVVPRTIAVAVGVTVWLGLFSALVSAGLVAAQPMPRLPLFFFGVNAVGLAFALGPPGTWLASGLSARELTAFQAFRLPLELVLHAWAAQEVIPETMTWTGANLDVVTGASAAVLAVIGPRGRAAYWAFDVLGLALLLNVARVALFSSPLPFAWPVVPPLQLALYLPYAYIAPVCVAGALAGHVILTRGLLRESRSTDARRGPTAEER